MSHPNKKRLRRSMMFLNCQKPGLIKDPYIYQSRFHYAGSGGCSSRKSEGRCPLFSVSRFAGN